MFYYLDLNDIYEGRQTYNAYYEIHINDLK